MEDRKSLDVLPPYEDEFLYSWAYRMVCLHSSDNSLQAKKNAVKFLFGGKCSPFLGLYYQSGLDYFVKQAGFKEGSIFSSYESILLELSIIPFYLYFLPEYRRNQFWKEGKNVHYRCKESVLGIRDHNEYIEGEEYLKVCPKCLEEGAKYLKKEHQIKGNYVCWKHGCVLNFLKVEESPYSGFDFTSAIERGIRYTPQLSSDQLQTARKIAEAIHDIFMNGIKDDLYTMKRKLILRLSETDCLYDDRIIRGVDLCCKDFDATYLYKHFPIRGQMRRAFLRDNIGVNPIIYIVLILRLFGSLEDFYKYKGDESARVIFNTVGFKIERDKFSFDIFS